MADAATQNAAGTGGYLGYAPIDCDIHPAVPDTKVLLPYFNDYWRENLVSRGIDRMGLGLSSYPSNAPTTARPDWRMKGKKAGSDYETLKTQALDAFGVRYAICNVLHAAQVFHSEDMSAVFCTAVNDWLTKEWLDRDTRLRASILVPTENPEMAVEEIERRAGDKRFVQVLMFAQNEIPLGKRFYWPIYKAAEKHGLAIGVHAGSLYRHAPSSVGWGSYYLEDYVLQAQAFESQLLSLSAEGAFGKFPALRVVFMESGFSWLPAFLWRANKTWRGVRSEVPWVKKPPADIIRHHVRITMQPIDEPPDEAILEQVINQIGSDEILLFSTDYPHWHFDGMDAMPKGLPKALMKKILVDNPLAAYPRLRD